MSVLRDEASLCCVISMGHSKTCVLRRGVLRRCLVAKCVVFCTESGYVLVPDGCWARAD